MRYFEEDTAERLKAEGWMLEALKANPDYCSWGPHEDYMWRPGRDETEEQAGRANNRDHGWESRVLLKTWSDFRPSFTLDDLNECVNFYFSIERDSKPCEECGQTGYHRDALWVSESFYSHSSPFRRQTPDEMQLSKAMEGFGMYQRDPLGRDVFPSEEILSKYGPEFRSFCETMKIAKYWGDSTNVLDHQALREAGRDRERSPLGFDAIDRHVMVTARLERYGIPQHCEKCEGHGYVFTSDKPRLALTLWWLHPRKGCSRGIEIANIEQHELLDVRNFLQEAAQRNADRFAKISLL